LGYLNKFSLLAFFVTAVVLGYQVFLFRKEISFKKKDPVIPDFQENLSVPKLNFTQIDTEKIVAPKKINLNFLLLIMVTFIVMVIVFMTLFSKKNTGTTTTQAPTTVNFIASKGIKLYDDKWKLLTELDVASLNGGEKIIIGIDKVSDVNIDGARIRINQNIWTKNDENVTYDGTKNIFYKEFVVATASSFLKIEAQLHSKVDGWLGE